MQSPSEKHRCEKGAKERYVNETEKILSVDRARMGTANAGNGCKDRRAQVQQRRRGERTEVTAEILNHWRGEAEAKCGEKSKENAETDRIVSQDSTACNSSGG